MTDYDTYWTENRNKHINTSLNTGEYLVLLTINTVQSFIVGTIYITIGKNLRVELFHNVFMFWISCTDELVITDV